tara:strand:- start:100442 stop:100858 length:417 start_codon:yes stop_codon:yes gene_type:complete
MTKETRIDHIGIATNSLDENSWFWSELGFKQLTDEINIDQGVKIRFFESENTMNHPKIELLEPIGSDSPIGRFIQKKGQGIQQLAISVENIDEMILRLKDKGCKMINESPVEGVSGSRIAFVHPSSTGGVLVELVEKI